MLEHDIFWRAWVLKAYRKNYAIFIFWNFVQFLIGFPDLFQSFISVFVKMFSPSSASDGNVWQRTQKAGYHFFILTSKIQTKYFYVWSD